MKYKEFLKSSRLEMPVKGTNNDNVQDIIKDHHRLPPSRTASQGGMFTRRSPWMLPSESIVIKEPLALLLNVSPVTGLWVLGSLSVDCDFLQKIYTFRISYKGVQDETEYILWAL